MRHRRLSLQIVLPLVALSWSLLAAGVLHAAADFAAQTGVLWRVQPPEGRASHVFGTIHSEDARVLRLPAPVAEALDEADSVTLEVVLDRAAGHRLSQAMFSETEPLRPLLDPLLYRQVESILDRYGVPAEAVAAMKPWAVVLALSSPPAETGTFLDKELYRRAVEAGKPVRGLESVAEQIAYFDELPVADQIKMLEDSVEQHDQLSEMHDALIEAYLERDLRTLRLLNEYYLSKSDPAVAELFDRRFITERNHLMVERMRPRLAEGGAFIAIGVLHLPGEEGILALLKNQGYEVSAVY